MCWNDSACKEAVCTIFPHIPASTNASIFVRFFVMFPPYFRRFSCYSSPLPPSLSGHVSAASPSFSSHVSATSLPFPHHFPVTSLRLSCRSPIIFRSRLCHFPAIFRSRFRHSPAASPSLPSRPVLLRRGPIVLPENPVEIAGVVVAHRYADVRHGHAGV